MIDAYYCFGEFDGVVLLEPPDDVAATAAVLAALGPGHIKSSRTTRLMTIEEGTEAMRRAGIVTYAGAPGMQANPT